MKRHFPQYLINGQFIKLIFLSIYDIITLIKKNRKREELYGNRFDFNR